MIFPCFGPSTSRLNAPTPTERVPDRPPSTPGFKRVAPRLVKQPVLEVGLTARSRRCGPIIVKSGSGVSVAKRRSQEQRPRRIGEDARILGKHQHTDAAGGR